mmetsp:Transcript_58787/g.164102  ORF Transcript_58787/g.164102 Transcript_58787/m.164102 type:complete len:676 (-) Transcript_58787:129-2156(-)
MASEGLEWLSDYVSAVLKSPTWVVPIALFVDEHCVVFDNSEENKLEYTDHHRYYKQLVEDLFAAHLCDVALTLEDFERFCTQGLASATCHRILAEQLLSVDDFITFKAMMVKRNAELNRQAALMLQQTDTSAGPAPATVAADTGVEAASLVHSFGGAAFAQWVLVEGALAWHDREYPYWDVPDEMLGATLFAGPCKTVPSGSLTFTTAHAATVYIWYESAGPGRHGGLKKWLRAHPEWVEVGGTKMRWVSRACKVPHEHPQVLTSLAATWACDGCNRPGEEASQRYRCTAGCDFDLCESCYGPEAFSVSVWTRTVGAGGCIDVPIQEPWVGGMAYKPFTGEWSLYEEQEQVTKAPAVDQQERPNFDEELHRAITLSQEAEEAEKRCEEAQLEQAIALSMQAEEERLRQFELGAMAVADVQPITDTAWQVDAGDAAELAGVVSSGDVAPTAGANQHVAPIEVAEPQGQAATGGTASESHATAKASTPVELPPVIPRVVRLKPLVAPPVMIDTSAFAAVAAQSSEGVEQMRAQAIQMRERAERVISAPAPAAAAAAGPTEEERRQRAEHLKRQRDLLIQKRNAEREAQLRAYQQSRGGTASAVDRAVEAAISGSRFSPGAGLGLAPPAAASQPDATQQDAAQQMRQALTLQLRQTLLASSSSEAQEQLNRLEDMKSP